MGNEEHCMIQLGINDHDCQNFRLFSMPSKGLITLGEVLLNCRTVCAGPLSPKLSLETGPNLGPSDSKMTSLRLSKDVRAEFRSPESGGTGRSNITKPNPVV